MADLVPITDPITHKTYRVHPWIAEYGEWIATSKTALRAQLPGMEAFERGVALAARPVSSMPRQPSTPTPVRGEMAAK